MKQSAVLMLVTALMVAMFVGVAEAKGRPAGKGKPAGKGNPVVTYIFKGEVASTSEGSVTVSVEKGNKFVQPYFDRQVEIAANGATGIEKDDAPAALTDVSAGDEVLVQVRAPKNGPDSFTARKIVAETPEVEEEEPTEETVPAG